MLSHIIEADIVPERMRFCQGALLPGIAAPATPRHRVGESAATPAVAAGLAVWSLRPQVPFMAARSDASAHAAAQAKSALQQSISQKFAYGKARNAAIGGGAMGPHPARDPV
jgi:hypothetical protein